MLKIGKILIVAILKKNMASVLNSHSYISTGVALYHIFWLLPFAVLSVLRPILSIIAVMLAFIHSICWSFKF